MVGQRFAMRAVLGAAGLILALLVAGCGPGPTQEPTSLAPRDVSTPEPGSTGELVEASIEFCMAGDLVVWNSSGERVAEGKCGFGRSDYVRLLLPADNRGASVQIRIGAPSDWPQCTEVKMRLPSGVYTWSHTSQCAEPSVQCPVGTRPYFYVPESWRLPTYPADAPDGQQETFVIAEVAEYQPSTTCAWECR